MVIDYFKLGGKALPKLPEFIRGYIQCDFFTTVFEILFQEGCVVHPEVIVNKLHSAGNPQPYPGILTDDMDLPSVPVELVRLL